MQRRACAWCALVVWAGGSGKAQGQAAESERAAAKQEGQKPEGLPGLPGWLKVGVQMRGRLEWIADGDEGLEQRAYLNRLRLNAVAAPRRWLRFVFEGQDARAVRLAGSREVGAGNPFDLRQGYAELGQGGEEGWQVRVGRQALASGDERLVGADSDWDAFGLTFDAVKLGWSRGRLRAEAFTGFRVEAGARRPDAFDTASRMTGLTAEWKMRGGSATVQPYVLWKRGGETLDLAERHGHRDVVTPGIRAQGELPAGMDYNVELALERGHVAGDRVAAWAGHWEAGWRPLGREFGLRVGLEYNYASGDGDPGDGRHQTFDDLYPAGYNRFGIQDPYAWRNIRYPAVGVEAPLTRRWSVFSGYRAYWLAEVRDGLYPGGDEYTVREAGASTSYLGSQVFVMAEYARSERWRIQAGYGHMLRGGYLREAGAAAAPRSVYVQSSFTY